MADDRVGRRWSDKLGTEYLAAEVLAERLYRLEQAIANETALRDRALDEYKQTLSLRMEQLNHLREEVLRDRATFVTREWADVQIANIEGRFRSTDRTIYMGLGGIAVIGALVEILLRVWTVIH